MYADRGTLTLILTDEDVGLEIVDDGPGIPDIDLALQEGYSTASDEMRELGFGFGMGLPNMRKNSDEFRIESAVGRGTSVFAKVRLNPHG
jgi:anti-sigma regulatory factor (Ser/Thr protein kinase)